jgi:hypothetical protein
VACFSLPHCIKEIKSICKVISKIFGWMVHRLAHICESCSMNYGVNSVFSANFRNSTPIGEICMHERAPSNGPSMSPAQVVQYYG